MRISDMHWQQVEAYLARDDRAVLPLGSTEQHAYLSLSVDSILSERVSAAAAEPLGVPVLPALAYGITPAFRAYPGTLTLRVETYLRVVEIDPVASHASWMENFPWTRLADIAQPDEQKPMTDLDRLRQLSPAEARAQLGDGNFGGRYQRPDADMQAIWEVAVAETRDVIDGLWPGDV